MRMRFKSALFFIVILIISVALIGLGYLFWTEIVSSPNIVVDGDITINYLDGNKFKTKDNSKISFSITNNSSDQKYYYIQITDTKGHDVNYTIKSDNDLESSGKLKSEILFNQIPIDSNITHNWVIEYTNNSSEKYAGTIKIGVKRNENNIFSEVVLDNNKVGDASLSNIGEEATLNEGLISTKDDLGMAYYFRGNVTNNNVHFADMDWKIVKINGDGSVKIVLSTLTEEIIKYYDEEYDFNNTVINEYLNEWYDNKLKDFSDYIVYNKYCNDLVMEQDSNVYIAYNRINTNKIPTNVCLGSLENLKIGLLTADEVMLAGGGLKENKEYYLYIPENDTPYWTMTSAQLRTKIYYPFIVSANGSITHNVAGNLLRGVRPVINIIKNAKVTGNGTVDNPYEIVEKAN